MSLGFELPVKVLVRNTLGNCFIVSSLFPFFGSPLLDSQPFPVLFAALYILALLASGETIVLAKNFFVFSVFIGIGSIFAFQKGTEWNLLSTRAVSGYIALPLYYLAFKNYLNRNEFPRRLLQFALFAWIAVAVVQLSEPNVASRFVAMRSNSIRGVTSLAPEPTHFAFFLFFLAWIILIVEGYRIDFKTAAFCGICLFGALVLAKSSMIVVFLVLAAGAISAFQLFSGGYRAFFCLVPSTLIGFFALTLFSPEGSRMADFLNSILVDGVDFFLDDKSSNLRISGIVLPFFCLIKNNFLPGGFSSYQHEALEASHRLWPLFPYDAGQKVMSWTMAMWYELGFFGLAAWLFLLPFGKCMRRNCETLLLLVLLFSAIPHLFPLPIMVIVLIDLKRNTHFGNGVQSTSQSNAAK